MSTLAAETASMLTELLRIHTDEDGVLVLAFRGGFELHVHDGIAELCAGTRLLRLVAIALA